MRYLKISGYFQNTTLPTALIETLQYESNLATSKI